MTEQLTWKERQKQRVRRWIKALLVRCFHVELLGNYQTEAKSVIIANRTSSIDLLLLAAFLPERLTVAIDPGAAGKLWMKMMMLFADVIAIDSTRAYAAKALIKAIHAGKRCVIFPQGLGGEEESLRVFDGPAMVLQKAGATVIPIRIDGPQYSVYSLIP